MTAWQAVTATARGSSHVRSGLPNQDAALVRDVPQAAAVVVAVADGHGGARYVRSDVGAGLAVAIACELGARFAAERATERDRSIQRRAAVELVPQLVDRWTASVRDHAAANPFVEEERTRAGVDLDHDIPFAYGATLLFSIATPDWVLIGQLGDGDVLAVDDDTSVSRPVPRDSRLVAGQTTSLCLPDAPTDLRLTVLPPASVQTLVLASDGYGNSFAGAEWWEAVGRDLQTQVGENGLAAVASSLPEWAADSAEVGGDDVTIAVLARVGGPAEGATAMLTVPMPVTRVPKPHRRSRRWLLLVVVVAVLAVIGGAVGIALAGDDDAQGDGAPTTTSPATTSTFTTTVAPAPTDPNLNKATLAIAEPAGDWHKTSPVTFAGTIDPGAHISVVIRTTALDGSAIATEVPVQLDGRSWRADVPLAAGANEIAIEATNQERGYNPNVVTRTIHFVPSAPAIAVDALSEAQRRFVDSIEITGTADAGSEIWLGTEKVADAATDGIWRYTYAGGSARLEFRAVNPAYPDGGAIAGIDLTRVAPATTARPRPTTTTSPAPAPTTPTPAPPTPPPATTDAPSDSGAANPPPGGAGATLPPQVCADPDVPEAVKNGRCP